MSARTPTASPPPEWLHGESLRRFQVFAEEWFASEWDWPVEWRDAAGSSDYLLELSAINSGISAKS